jgi:superfamily I DNA/RNA helicase
VVSVATGHAAAGRFVGIVCPDRCRRELEAALAANAVTWSSAERGELGSAINLVSPTEAKGLEFDAVVVVEPERIVAENERGLRMLYVALTRTTGYLDVVCVGDPLPLTAPDDTHDEDETARGATFGDRDRQDLASHITAQIRAASPPAAWSFVIAEAARLLGESEA